MRHLEPGEGLVASLVGYEEGGRRRHVVLATDRRIVIAPVRPAPPLDLGYRELVDVDGTDGALVLTTRDGERVVVERVEDRGTLRLLVELLRGRAGEPAGHHAPGAPKVRIVS